MAGIQLTARLSGMTAMCLAVMMAPLAAAGRVAVLTAAVLGVAFASVMPGHERLALRVAGPAILILALVPATEQWAMIDLLAVFLLGFAGFDHPGMSRVVPALGLPIATMAFRTGELISPILLGSWVVAVVATLALSHRAWPIGGGQRFGTAPAANDPRTRARRRRSMQAAAVLAAIVPVSMVLAGVVERELPTMFVSQPNLGELAGPQLRPHPGLTGGLDAGQPVSLSDDVVLRVEADRPLYWRGTTYERWDGRRWTSEVATSRISWDGDGVQLPRYAGQSRPPSRAGGGRSLPAPVTVVQQFEAERAGIDVVLGAWRMETVWITADGGALGEDGSLRLDDPLGAGASWTVESELVPATEDDLRRADPAQLDRSAPFMQRYAVEDDLTAEVAELAASITAETPTTYDKVRALEAWMDRNITYTRDIEPLAAGDDAVHHLLFESRQGYCEQIGSALVVMLRSLGVPARLVVGYVPGEYDSSTGTWVSRGTDAHAWAEVYFPGVGWRGFDPTAGVPSAPSGDHEASISAGVPSAVALVAVALVAIAGAVGLAAAVGPRWLRLLRWRRRSGPGRGDGLVELQRRFDACGGQLDLVWPVSATLREKGDSLVEAGVDPGVVRAATSALERLWFVEVDHRRPDELADPVAVASTSLGDLERAVAVVGGVDRRLQTAP